MALFAWALSAATAAVTNRGFTDSFVSVTLSGFRLCMGIVYHLLFFSKINAATVVFGLAFFVQGVLFLYDGAIKKRVSFGVSKRWSAPLGACVLAYALVVYPLLGHLLGHRYPAGPTFGVPCPATIFTFGVLLWTDQHVPTHLLVIPTLWEVIGTSAAFLLGVWEDLGLLAAALIGVTDTALRQRTSKPEAEVQYRPLTDTCEGRADSRFASSPRSILRIVPKLRV